MLACVAPGHSKRHHAQIEHTGFARSRLMIAFRRPAWFRPVRARLLGSKAGSQAILFWAVEANPSLAGIGTAIQPRRFPAGRWCRNSRGVWLPNSCGSASCRQKGFDHAHQSNMIKRKFLRSMDDGPRIGRESWVRSAIPCPNGRRAIPGLLSRTRFLVLSPAMQFCPRRYMA